MPPVDTRPECLRAEVRATANVLQAAGFDCSGLLDEPSAANNVLNLQEGAIVDVGGGTTGVAVVQNGEVVSTADEPCGGTHFSLVIAGSMDIPFEEAEERKIDPAQQSSLFPAIKAVMEKVGAIVNRSVVGANRSNPHPGWWLFRLPRHGAGCTRLHRHSDQRPQTAAVHHPHRNSPAR